ncbi:hypothetical protein X744_31920 [Mesorhizobium sp. LNJC372A00]|nr:hypothetical protein X745_31275 [Mesorhizobium sp. LNJC374B00]ESY50738.1 hypothetical protein X744_31920 [Mesorhizobium sp. LNJC372A00]
MTWIKTWDGVVANDWLDELGHVNFLVYQDVKEIQAQEIFRSL